MSDDDFEDLDDDTHAPLHEIVMVRHTPIAFPATLIDEVLPMPQAAPMPLQPPTMRGMVWVRSDLIPTFDLRVLLAQPSAAQEFDDLRDLLAARRADHLRWITELEASVRERRPFTLARDPTQCAFGRWYGSFRPDDHHLTSVSAQSLLRAFDRPHRAIHALADEVLTLAVADRDAALAAIDRARDTTLGELLRLFDEAQRDLHGLRRELCLVVRVNGRRVGLAVDAVRAIEALHAIAPATDAHVDTARLAALRGWWKPSTDAPALPVEIVDAARLAAAVGLA